MRLEGWPELGEHPCSGDGCLECRDYANREAGASAMLEGLRKGMPVRYVQADEIVEFGPNNTFTTNSPGYLVFIPEEEK